MQRGKEDENLQQACFNTALHHFLTTAQAEQASYELLWSYGTGDIVWDVSVSADGSHVAAGSRDDKVYFFNFDAEEMRKEEEAEEWLTWR